MTESPEEEPWTDEQYMEEAHALFEDFVEEIGLGPAVASYLSAIGEMSVATGTVPYAIKAMQMCVDTMVQMHNGSNQTLN